MSKPSYANVPVGFFNPAPATFTITSGTAAKIVVDQLPAVAASALAPLQYGGGSIIDLIASSTDGTARDLLVYTGTVGTTVGGTTGAVTTTTSTIPRASGSFIADGFQVGDMVMTFAPPGTASNASVDGIPCVVTAVAALGLTLNGTPIAALTLATGTRIVRMMQKFRATVALNSGNTAAAPNVKLLGHANDSSAVSAEYKIGPANIVAAAMQSAVSALPAQVSVGATVAMY